VGRGGRTRHRACAPAGRAFWPRGKRPGEPPCTRRAKSACARDGRAAAALLKVSTRVRPSERLVRAPISSSFSHNLWIEQSPTRCRCLLTCLCASAATDTKASLPPRGGPSWRKDIVVLCLLVGEETFSHKNGGRPALFVILSFKTSPTDCVCCGSLRRYRAPTPSRSGKCSFPISSST
jgi:hypothetical protein